MDGGKKTLILLTLCALDCCIMSSPLRPRVPRHPRDVPWLSSPYPDHPEDYNKPMRKEDSVVSRSSLDPGNVERAGHEATLLQVGVNKAQQVVNNLEVLLSVPTTHIGDTKIVSATLSISASSPFRYIVVAQKNETKCVTSTDPQCPSMIREPALDISVSSRASNGKPFTYSNSITGSMGFQIQVGPEVSVSPRVVNGEGGGITVWLDVYTRDNTRRGSFSSSRQDTRFTLNAEYITTTGTEDGGPGNGPGNGAGNGPGNGAGNGAGNGPGDGQSTLRSAPLCALLLPALLPVLLLK